MSRDKLIIIGAVVLGLLGVLVYHQAQTDASMGAPTATTADYPTISAPEDVDKISLTNGDKVEVVLEKVVDPTGSGSDGDGGTATVTPMKWVMTKPLRAEANQQAVKDLVANMKSLKVDSPVNLKLDDDVRKDKQLDAAHALHLVAWKNGDKKADESFGKSGPAGQLVIVASKPNAVWAAKDYSSYLYSKEPKDFRDKEIFHFDDADVTAVDLVNSHGTFAFLKGDKWTGTLGKKPIERFDGEKVKDMLRTYKSLNADDFGDGKSPEETGLDNPETQLTIHGKDGKVYALSVGKISTGTDRWAKRPDADTVYQLTNYAAEWVTSDASKYQTVIDGGAASSDAGAKPKPPSTAKK